MSTPPSIGDILNSILSAIQGVIGAVANAIADNAEVIGTVLIIGALIVAVMSIGRKSIGGLMGWFKGML